jgi:hypothetical protein
MVTKGTCDYKYMTSDGSGTNERFKKKYKTLVGKNPPPIDNWEFMGAGQPATRIYSRQRNMPEQRWVNGKHTKYTYHETSPVVGIFCIVRPYSTGGTHIQHMLFLL